VRNSGRHLYRGGGGRGEELAGDANVEAVILAVIALDLKLREVVLTQKLGQGLDEGDVAVVVFAHGVLVAPFGWLTIVGRAAGKALDPVPLRPDAACEGGMQ
jgi:hypothetical protein